MTQDGPARRFLCMYCRCLLDDDQRHRALGHEVVPFDAHGRSALILATRPSTLSHRPRSHDELTGVVVTAAIVGVLVLSILATGFGVLSGVIALGFVGLWIGLAIRARTQQRPALAHHRATLPASAGARDFSGVLHGDHYPDPLTGTPCLAFSIELHNLGATAGTLLCRDERCFGATLQADDETLVRLPPTSTEVHGESRGIDPGLVNWQQYMRNAGIVTDGGHILFHVDEIRVSHLFSGDRVTLSAAVEIEANPNAAATHYREGAAAQLVALGTPVVRRQWAMQARPVSH